jgi:hypothetical protein
MNGIRLRFIIKDNFEEDRRLKKLKDFEVKRRTKEDLDNQIRHKLRTLNDGI